MTTKRMNYQKITGACAMAIVLLFAGGCIDHFDNLNTPDDRLSTVNLDASNLGQALARSQHAAVAGHDYQTFQNMYADNFAQYFFTTNDDWRNDRFEDNDLWTNRNFQSLYRNTMPGLDFIVKLTEVEEMHVHNAIARVVRVYFFHRITDVWGPIPYSNYGTGETTIYYDSQEDIYLGNEAKGISGFFDELDAAVAVFANNAGGSAFTRADNFTTLGQVDKWWKFANSLRLRLAMRIVYADEARAQAEAEKAIADPGGFIESNTDNVYSLTDSDNNDSMLRRMIEWDEFRMSAAMHSLLHGYDDPRMPLYFRETVEDGVYRGTRNGIPDEHRVSAIVNPRNSHMGEYWTQNDIPFAVMRAAEVYFLRAEGDLRGWNMGGSAQNLYADGIRMSMTELEDYYPISTAEIEAYINNTNTPVAVPDDGIDPADHGAYNTPAISSIPVRYEVAGSFERRLEQINTQKWLGLYPDGMEAYNNYKRVRYPRLYPIIDSVNPDIAENEILRRITYGSSEYNNNGAAVQQAVSELLGGGDNNSTPVWWDKHPDGAVKKSNQ